MTTIHSTLAALLLLAASSALAGPDFYVIEQARKAAAAQATNAASATNRTDADHQALSPIDHGPRVQTTPWLNAKRKALAA